MVRPELTMTEPNKWMVQRLANVGTSEQFMGEWLELLDILQATTIFGEERERAKEAIVGVLIDGLTPAFTQFREIRESVAKEMPLLDRYKLYEDFAGRLWKAHKTLFQNAATVLGFNVGFLFQEDKSFEAGHPKFIAQNPGLPSNFESYTRAMRSEWQNDLSKFRNTVVEHTGGDRKDFQKFYDPRFCEELFFAVWDTDLNFLVCLMNLKMSHGFTVIEVDRNANPTWSKRFQFQQVNAPTPSGEK
jgi:hypothetical protein